MGKVAFGTQSSFFVQVNTDRGMQSCWSIRLKLPSFTSSSIPSHHPLGSNIALYYQCIKPLFVFFFGSHSLYTYADVRFISKRKTTHDPRPHIQTASWGAQLQVLWQRRVRSLGARSPNTPLEDTKKKHLKWPCSRGAAQEDRRSFGEQAKSHCVGSVHKPKPRASYRSTDTHHARRCAWIYFVISIIDRTDN